MRYKPEDFIQYVLEKDPNLTEWFTDRKFSEIFSEPLTCGKITKDHKNFYDDEMELVYKFEYNTGRLLYFEIDVFDNWYLQKRRDYLLEDLGV